MRKVNTVKVKFGGGTCLGFWGLVSNMMTRKKLYAIIRHRSHVKRYFCQVDKMLTSASDISEGMKMRQEMLIFWKNAKYFRCCDYGMRKSPYV